MKDRLFRKRLVLPWYASETLPEGSLRRGSHPLRYDFAQGAAFGGIEALTDLVDHGELADADVEGLLGVLGGSLIAVLF